VCPRIPHALFRRGGGIRLGVCAILRAGVWCAITPISPLSAIVMWPRATTLDPLRDLAHGGLCDLV
jgi:hypothetical protein